MVGRNLINFIFLQLNVWTSKQELWQDLEKFDQKLSLLYRDMGQETNLKPNVAAIKTALHNTIHSMEMSYGTCGSLFRLGLTEFSAVMCFCKVDKPLPFSKDFYDCFENIKERKTEETQPFPM